MSRRRRSSPGEDPLQRSGVPTPDLASDPIAPPPRRPGQLALSGVLYALWIAFLAAMAGLG